jgi:pyruvate formate-lyase activating enzyme-like uncharacterized protein
MTELNFDYGNEITAETTEEDVRELFEDECGVNLNGGNPIETLRKIVRWLRDLGNEQV